jgi:dTDP-4-dehydrorhamnose reductase
MPSEKRILVVGASGLIGSHVYARLSEKHDVVGTRRARDIPGLLKLDAADPRAVVDFYAEHGPFSHVVACMNPPSAAWCEKHPDFSWKQQVEAHANLVEDSPEGTGFVCFSSDYVFDGEDAPYEENDTPNPLQVFGEHKHEMEEVVGASDHPTWILRSSVVYGTNRLDPELSSSYVALVRKRLLDGQSVAASHDQVSCPTWAGSIAEVVEAIVAGRVLPGLWHAAGRSPCTRYEFAQAIVERFGLDDKAHLIERVSLRVDAPEEAGGGLRRPRDSRLDSSWLRNELGHDSLCGYREGLRRMSAGD